MQEDRGICFLLKEMFTREETERRRGERGKPWGGDAWGAEMGSRTA